MSAGPLLIRADASAAIGSGHVMRCLALAEAWQLAGGVVCAASVELPELLKHRLNAACVETSLIGAEPGSDEDAECLVGIARQVGAQWVVLDGYHFGEGYQAIVRSGAVRLALIDDFGFAYRSRADAILNQNPWAEQALYPATSNATLLLLGPRYVLLRTEFLRWRGWRRVIPRVATRLLVTMGGGDSGDITGAVVRALEYLGMPELEVVVVLGPANQSIEALQDWARQSRLQTRVLTSQEDMASLMAWADMAAASSGSTSWELAFMGLPTCGFSLAPNQDSALTHQVEKGCFVQPASTRREEVVSTMSLLSRGQELRAALSSRGRLLVDGLGSSRVAAAIAASARSGPAHGENVGSR